MSEPRSRLALGSIWDAEDADDVPRGRNLVWTARVRRSELASMPLRVEVPQELRTEEGVLVARHLDPSLPQDEVESSPTGRDFVTLNVPADLPSGTRLRLRGFGEAHPEGAPGDLLLRLRIEEDSLTKSKRLQALGLPQVALAGAALAGMLFLITRLAC